MKEPESPEAELQHGSSGEIRHKYTPPWTVGGQDESVISLKRLHADLIKTMAKPAHADCTIKTICSNSSGIFNAFIGKVYQSQRVL